jgi:hypothetical protein
MRHWTRSALLRYKISDFFSSLLGDWPSSLHFNGHVTMSPYVTPGIYMNPERIKTSQRELAGKSSCPLVFDPQL